MNISDILSKVKSKFSQLSIYLTGKQVLAVSYMKTVLWLASWIKEQPVSREPKIFNLKDDANIKET